MRIQALDFFFGYPGGGDVVRDFGKAAQLAGFIAQSGQHALGKEPGAVFAEAPAFVESAALQFGFLQGGLGGLATAGLRGKEDGKMFAHDLFGRVSFESFGAFVPGSNFALWIEHADGIVLNPLEQ